MNYIKTIAAFAVTIIAMIAFMPFAIIFFPLGFAGLKKPAAFFVYCLVRGWARMIVFLTRCPMTVTGTEHIPRSGGFCLVSNHVGVFDIVLALAYAGRPFGFIAKKELLFLPGINVWIYLLGGLFIDRRRPRKALKTINRGINRIRKGGGMLIFPEGTRSRGGALKPFHPGSLKLASQPEAPIIPVAITGSYGVFEETGLVKAVPVSITFLPPVYPSDIPYQDRKQFLAEKLQNAIKEVLQSHVDTDRRNPV